MGSPVSVSTELGLLAAQEAAVVAREGEIKKVPKTTH